MLVGGGKKSLKHEPRPGVLCPDCPDKFWVKSLGFRDFMDYFFRYRVWEFRVWSLEFGVGALGLGFRGQGLRSGFWVLGLGFRVAGVN